MLLCYGNAMTELYTVAADIVTNHRASGSPIYSDAYSNTTILRTVIQQRTLLLQRRFGGDLAEI